MFDCTRGAAAGVTATLGVRFFLRGLVMLEGYHLLSKDRHNRVLGTRHTQRSILVGPFSPC